HIEPLGQCGGRLLAQKSPIFGVDTDRTDLIDDSDCLHGSVGPFSATSPLNASVHAISLLFALVRAQIRLPGIHWVQSSSTRPGTRAKSRTLRVIRTPWFSSTIAAIRRSIRPTFNFNPIKC